MIRPLAYVHPDTRVAKGVIVEPSTTISGDVEIGEGTWIGPNVTIMEGAHIGKNCGILPGAVILAIPRGLKCEKEGTATYIGDNTTIRKCVAINKSTTDRVKTVVGNNCLIMAYSHVAHDCVIGEGCIFSNSTTLTGHVAIGDFVVMAGVTAVYQFSSVGSYAFITGGAIISRDVPPCTKAAHNPISYVGASSIGLHGRGFSVEKIREIQDIYRMLFQKKLTISHALEYIEAGIEATIERDEILQFMRKPQHNIVKSYYGEGI